MSCRCIIDAPNEIEEIDLVINPILDWFTVLEKIRLKVVYSKVLERDIIVKEVYGSYPVYLPEIGYFTALEISSRNLSRKFYSDTKDLKGFYSSENKIVIAKIHNFDRQTNRFVTWGNYNSYKIPEKYYLLYISNLINDFLITPSIARKGTLFSPNRWFIQDSHSFTALVCFNIGIVYLTKDDTKRARKTTLRIGNIELDAWSTRAKLITLSAINGIDSIENLYLYFPGNPPDPDMIIPEKGDYFIGFLLSLNGYKSGLSKNSEERNINIIEDLSPLAFIPEEIVPFMFPSIANDEILYRVVFEFEISKSIYELVIKKFIKFSDYQNPEVLENYTRSYARPLHISEHGNTLRVKILNPIIVPFLLKQCVLHNKGTLLEELAKYPGKMVEELAKLNKTQYRYSELYKLPGLGRILRLRGNILAKYVETWKSISNNSKYQ